jgi:hypothetical protein
MVTISTRVSTKDRINVVVEKKRNVLVDQSGVIAFRRLGELLDVDTSTQVDGSILIYDEDREKYIASTLLEKQQINGGHF